MIAEFDFRGYIDAERGSMRLLVAMIDCSNRAGMSLADLLGGRPTPKVAEVRAAIARHFNIPEADLVSDRRSREVAWPRQNAMYLARQLTPASLPMIGKLFGGRDHTTVMHAIRSVEERIGKGHEETVHAVERVRTMFAGSVEFAL